MPSGDLNELELGSTMRGPAGKEQKLFGRYTLKRVLGRGGMGIVWLAHDDELNRHVAMKFLPDMLVRDREAVEDLKRETRRSLDLTHHHIVRIYDFTQDEMVAAIIMEYVDGETLSAMKTQQPGGCFSVSVAAPWVGHFASALDYAHRQARVIHRDLKPANLMVNSRGDMKITDFGISRSMSDSMTRVSVSNTAGTLAYMSPEQALGAPPAPGDDIYAFGATVFDLLTGRPPFFRGNLQVQLETVTPPRMTDRRAELGNSGEPIPDLWEEVIAKCLAKRAQDRPESIAEVAAMLGLSAPGMPGRAAYNLGTSTGTSPGTSATRSRTDEVATDTNFAPNTPGTAPQPGTYRPPVNAPKPTSLGDILGGMVTSQTGPQSQPTLDPSAVTAPIEDVTIKPTPGAGLKPKVEEVAQTAPFVQEPAPAANPLTDAKPASTSGKSSSGMALVGLGTVAALAVGGAVFMFRPAKEPKIETKQTAQATPVAPSAPTTPKVDPVAVAQPPTTPVPVPTYEKEVAEIQGLIASSKLDEAGQKMLALPPELPALAALRTSFKAETDRLADLKKNEEISKLITESDSKLKANPNDFDAAREPLQKITNRIDVNNKAANDRLAAIDAAEKKFVEMKEAEDARKAAALAAAQQPASPPPVSVTPPAPTEPEAPKSTAARTKPEPTKKPTATKSRTVASTKRDDDPPAPKPKVDRPPAVPQAPVRTLPPPRSSSGINRGTNIGG